MLRRCLLALLLALLLGVAVNASAVTVTFRVTVPESTPEGDTVYITGLFQNWNPGDPDWALTPEGGNVHSITSEFETGSSIQFKFTRGSWDTVEKGPSGEEIVNRVLTLNESRTYELNVPRWADTSDVETRTLTGDVTEHTVPGLLDGRRVWVYLPPGYHEGDERHPVHYMLDGQNVFDVSTSFVGEWEVDETCERLIAAGDMRPIIVVALDNGGGDRVHEYTPTVDPGRNAGGGAAEHFEAIVGTLKPWVEANYRVKTGPDDTGFSGSSLGGLMSLYAALHHGDVFGRIGAISPSIWWDDHVILDMVDSMPKPAVRLWADMGTDEGSTQQNDQAYVDDLELLKQKLIAKGFVENEDLVVFVDPGARHNEQSWSQRYDEVLKYLYPPEQTGVRADPTGFGALKARY